MDLFSKYSELKVITLKLIVLLYISNKEIENEILKKYTYNNIKKQHKT